MLSDYSSLRNHHFLLQYFYFAIQAESSTSSDKISELDLSFCIDRIHHNKDLFGIDRRRGLEVLEDLIESHFPYLLRIDLLEDFQPQQWILMIVIIGLVIIINISEGQLHIFNASLLSLVSSRVELQPRRIALVVKALVFLIFTEVQIVWIILKRPDFMAEFKICYFRQRI